MYDIYQSTKTPLWDRFCSAYGFSHFAVHFYVPLLRLSLLKDAIEFPAGPRSRCNNSSSITVSGMLGP